MIKEIVKLLSNLEKSKEENHQALHNGDIEILFDNEREINYEYLRICDIKPYGNPPRRYYSFSSEKNKKVDGVYETDLDLLSEIYKILKIKK